MNDFIRRTTHRNATGYIELSDQNPFDNDVQDEQVFRPSGLHTKMWYWFFPETQFEHLYRAIRLDKTCFPPIYQSNYLDNQKYNVLTFLPVFLWNQFKYFYNFYYLVICVSQFFPIFKIGLLISYIGPLGFVLAFSLIGEITDDLSRWRQGNFFLVG
jgi:hypothetical protein